MICPRCRSGACSRSRRKGVSDHLATCFGLRPWRCHSCEERFQAWRVAVPFSMYAHCPRCGNFDLEHIGRDRVGFGASVFVQRFFGFPAYRCDPCRQRFFSLRQFRRILPSTVAEPTSGVPTS